LILVVLAVVAYMVYAGMSAPAPRRVPVPAAAPAAPAP